MVESIQSEEQLKPMEVQGVASIESEKTAESALPRDPVSDFFQIRIHIIRVVSGIRHILSDSW